MTAAGTKRCFTFGRQGP